LRTVEARRAKLESTLEPAMAAEVQTLEAATSTCGMTVRTDGGDQWKDFHQLVEGCRSHIGSLEYL